MTREIIEFLKTQGFEDPEIGDFNFDAFSFYRFVEDSLSSDRFGCPSTASLSDVKLAIRNGKLSEWRSLEKKKEADRALLNEALAVIHPAKRLSKNLKRFDISLSPENCHLILLLHEKLKEVEDNLTLRDLDFLASKALIDFKRTEKH